MSKGVHQGQVSRGCVLSDCNKKAWIVGSFFGTDGSELSAEMYTELFNPSEYIYSAEYKGDTPSNYPALLKIKPHGDAHFASEINFYEKHASCREIAKWRKTQNIQYDDLGVPRYLGHGRNVIANNVSFDFVLLFCGSKSLQTVLTKHNNLCPTPTVLKVAYHIVRVLEYFHATGMVHGDIRASNLWLRQRGKRHVYLLPQFHTVDESDRDAVMFWSEDRHCGAKTNRGDFESLLYNLIDWSGGILTWKNAPLNEVKDMKIRAFENPEQFLQDAFPACKCKASSGCSALRRCAASGEAVAPFKCLRAISDLMDQVASMKKKKTNDCKPNYKAIEDTLGKRLLNMCHVPTGALEFSVPTFIDDEDHEEPYTPGVGIAIDTLAHIIAENCSSFEDVNRSLKESSDPSPKSNAVSRVVAQKKKKSKVTPQEVCDILRHWERNTDALRTKVIEQWRLKRIEPGDFEAWKKENSKQQAAKKAEERALKIAKKKVSNAMNHESPAQVEHSDERNGSEPIAPKDMAVDKASSCQSLQSERLDSQENGPAEKSPQRERSLSPSRLRDCSSSDGTVNPPELSTPACQSLQQARSPSPSKSDYVQNSTDSSGFNSRCPSDDRSCAEDSSCSIRRVDLVRHQSSKEVVVETKEATAKTNEQVLAAHQQWHENYEWLNAWLSLKEKTSGIFGPISSEPQVMASQVQEVWVLRDEFDMQQPRLRHLLNVLAKLPTDSAEARKINRIEQRWLSMLAWLEEMARKLNDTLFSQLRDVLKGNEILVWLIKEIDDMSEKPLVSADREALRQQFEKSQAVHQRIMDKEAEVTQLLNEGCDVLTRSQNLENANFKQLFFDVMQLQWTRLKNHALEIHAKLKSCFEHSEKYYRVRKPLLHWLSKAANKLLNLQPVLLDDIGKQMKELSVLSDEVLEKSVEFERNQTLGETFIDACDDCKDGMVKNELTAMKNRWNKLNNDLFQRTQLLGDIDKSFAGFNESLCHLKDKLDLCENELTSYHALGEADKVSNHPDSIKRLQEEIIYLQGPLDILIRRTTDLVHKSRKQKIDVSHLLKEVNRVGARFASLKVKLVGHCDKIFEQQLSLDRELKQAENYVHTVQEKIEETKVSLGKMNQLSENITGLVNDVQKAMQDLGLATDAQVRENDNNKKVEPSRKKRKKRRGTTSNSKDCNSDNSKTSKNRKFDEFGIKSRASLKSSKVQNQSVPDFTPPRAKKLKYSKDLGGGDSNVSLLSLTPQIKKERDEINDFNTERD